MPLKSLDNFKNNWNYYVILFTNTIIDILTYKNHKVTTLLDYIHKNLFTKLLADIISSYPI
jgi:hypothetical protein